MRVALKELCQKLGIIQILGPYETYPWVHYDATKKITCSAEVRMGPDLEDLEAEIQLLKDEGDSEDESSGSTGMPEQIMILRALPAGGEWEVKVLTVKKKDYVNEFSEWDEKGCNFFRACTSAIHAGEIPDFDALIEQELDDDDFFGSGRRGRIGRKAPKINPAALLGMKKGM